MSAPVNPNSQISSNGFLQTPKISPYELSREERIKENLQRMQKLGIADLSHKLNSLLPPKRPRRNPSLSPCSSPLPLSGPIRRSSRLQNTAPVSYSEVRPVEKKRGVRLEEGIRPEVYTKEHEKLLGNTERSWTLFVDGYRQDGSRIYDPVKGKTCHQCRQKTLGHRTQCSKCNMIQGQFCGDCLYMRYGEHVREALEDPKWVCPVCRGICNCSLCRNAKGWVPTGTLYKKITKLGFKSVAHYLIQTKQANTDIEKNADDKQPVSAKRSLSFPEKEVLEEETQKDDGICLAISMVQSEETVHIDSHSVKENTHRESNPAFVNETPVEKSNCGVEFKDRVCEGIELKANGQDGFSELDVEDKSNIGFKGEDEKESHFPCKEQDNSSMTLELSSDRKHDFHSDDATRMTEEAVDAKQDINKTFLENEMEKEKLEPHADNEQGESNISAENHSKHKKRDRVADTSTDGIGRGLRQRRIDAKAHNSPTSDAMLSETELQTKEEVPHGDNQDVKGSVRAEGGLKRKRRHSLATEPSVDSVAGRLRQRRREGSDNDTQVFPETNQSASYDKAVNKTSSSKDTSTGTNPDSVARRLRPRNRTT